jgi:hypothetical protein
MLLAKTMRSSIVGEPLRTENALEWRKTRGGAKSRAPWRISVGSSIIGPIGILLMERRRWPQCGDYDVSPQRFAR